MAIGNLKIENYVAVVKQNEGLYTEYDIETTGNLIVGGDITLTDDIAVDALTAGTITIDQNANATALTIDTEATTANAVDINGNTLTTGKLIDMSDLDAITTGKAIHIDATGVTQTSGILVHVDSAGTAITGAGRLFLSDHTGVTTTSGVLNEFKTAANDESVLLELDAASLTTGVILDVIGTALTTGTGVDVGGLDALTTGTAINVVSNSSDTGTRSLVKVVNDNTAATGATGLTVQQDADLAAIAITGVTTTGIDFTALGNTDRIFNATAGTGSTAAPQTNAPTGFIKIAVAGTDQWIPYYNAT